MATIAVEYLGGSDDDALYLPCKDSELEKVLRAIRSDGGNEIIITNVMWPEGLSILNGQTVDVDELNYLFLSASELLPAWQMPGDIVAHISAIGGIGHIGFCWPWDTLYSQPAKSPYHTQGSWISAHPAEIARLADLLRIRHVLDQCVMRCVER